VQSFFQPRRIGSVFDRIWSIFYQGIGLLNVRRMVNLGAKLIPISKGALAPGAMQKYGYVGKFNTVLRLLYILQSSVAWVCL